MEYLIRASHFICRALRHNPDAVGITLDSNGWTSVHDLLHSLERHDHHITLDLLAEIVATDEKGRYTLSDDRRLIRANYGHSRDINPILPPDTPPDILFHGTAQKNLPLIKRDGLLKRSRQFVHLVTDLPTAFTVGERHGTPVVIPVDAATMFADGHQFYHTSDVWLTKSVPSQYLVYNGLLFLET